jgi:hypothetical protein
MLGFTTSMRWGIRLLHNLEGEDEDIIEKWFEFSNEMNTDERFSEACNTPYLASIFLLASRNASIPGLKPFETG